MGYEQTDGINILSHNRVNYLSKYDRNYCFGYRFGLRQPYNRPRWSMYTRGFLELYDYSINFASTTPGDYHTKSIIMRSTIDDIKRKFVFDNSTSYTNGAVKDADARIPEVWVRVHGFSTKLEFRQAFEEALNMVNTRIGRTIFEVKSNPKQNTDEENLHIGNVANFAELTSLVLEEFLTKMAL